MKASLCQLNSVHSFFVSNSPLGFKIPLSRSSFENLMKSFILQLIAVYEEQDSLPKPDDTDGSLTDGNSPDAFESDVAAQLAAFQPIGGEIEVTPSALKLGISSLTLSVSTALSFAKAGQMSFK